MSPSNNEPPAASQDAGGNSDSSSSHSVTHCIRGMENGDQTAIERLWSRYFDKLVRLAKGRMGTNARRIADEEDVAIDVFSCLCRSAQEGKLAMKNRDELWRLLLTITKRKVIDQHRHETRAKRQPNAVTMQLPADDQLGLWDDTESRRVVAGAELSDIAGPEPTPDTIVRLDEEFRYRLQSLDSVQRRIVQYKLESYTNEEIARKLGVATRTVERKLNLIRKDWEKEIDASSQATD